MLKTICPGKFLVGVHAGVAAVQASVEAGLACAKDTTVDHFIIPNIHPDVISAISCAIEEITGDAVGIIETFSAASSILAADLARQGRQRFPHRGAHCHGAGRQSLLHPLR